MTDDDDPGAIYRPLLRIKPGASRARVRQIVDQFRRRLDAAKEANKETDRAKHLEQLRRTNSRFDTQAIANRHELFEGRPEPEPVEVDDDAALTARLGLAREPRRHGPLERPAEFDAFLDDDQQRGEP